MLTRDLLDCGNNVNILPGTPAQPAWTMDVIEQSKQDTLSGRPTGTVAWLFAYGSLVWNPVIDTREQRMASLLSRHRSFYLRLIAGQTTRSVPGRMLAWQDGGKCSGLACRLEEDNSLDEPRLVSVCEIVHGLCRPVWTREGLTDGRIASAFVFVADSEHPQNRVTHELNAVAIDGTTASSPFGSDREYLTYLEEALTRWEIRDSHVSNLARRVRELARMTKCQKFPGLRNRLPIQPHNNAPSATRFRGLLGILSCVLPRYAISSVDQ
ncbi:MULTISPECIES: gamma-glutamylcyclotransferase [Achromobacter]|uniref:glutathione-specific gamma-glutamylcyclotransferase n=1 Tax=Achromobacter mucicolens TaxID=1389922 RepID=A0ABM8LJV9_9BURK|nr:MULTISPECIES: gamma-glutamylcyclotransferase [Achromobacter]AVG44062.1 cation transporter [Achromobacter insolitus]CAB3848687.1 Glutathione-specific gamma-glutamylcyclotransferase [Achromobacter aegrifaciens]CAB3911440.1 Glutathione-specific gamma-glutamylcyclotransferase [Achromobacter mucicolens]